MSNHTTHDHPTRTETSPAPAPAAYEMPSAAVLEVRRLLHDMNNSLEIIIQATYLIGTLEMTEDGKQWLKLLEQAVEQVTHQNKDLRDKIRTQQLP